MLRHDPDARFSRKGYAGYKVHRMVDHKYGVILSDLATPANVPDPNVVPDMLRDFKQKFKIQHKYLAKDSGYRHQHVLKFVHEIGYDIYMPLEKTSNSNKEMFGPEKFVYDKEKNILFCPEGKELKFKTHRIERSIYAFKADARECNSCPQKHKCTSSDKGRTSQISENDKLILELMEKKKTKKYKTLMKKRQIYSEGSFGEAKVLHGMEKAYLRGLENMSIQSLMTSILQNIKKLIKYTQKPRSGNNKMIMVKEIHSLYHFISQYYTKISIYIVKQWSISRYLEKGMDV